MRRGPSDERLADADGEDAAALDAEMIRAAISHELRAPLRAVIGFAEILRRSHACDLDAEGRLYLDHVIHAGRRMDVLCDGLLDYLRLGRARVRREPIDVGRVIAGLERELAPELEAAGARLEVAGALPRPLGDEALTSIALRVLIANACAYRRPDVAPRIAIAARVETDLVVISVADNGTGIEPEDLGKIFRPFQRLVSQETVPGLGLGLTSARKALLLQHGSLAAESTPGAGSCFEIRLPHAGTPG